MGGVLTKRKQARSTVAQEARAAAATVKEATDSAVHALTELQLEEFREAFHAFDDDGGGTLDRTELLTMFRSLGQEPSQDEVDRMIAAADVDGSGTIDFEEFTVLMAHMIADRETAEAKRSRMLKAFEVFDADGNGNVSANEMRLLLINLGEPVELEDVDKVISMFDRNDDGELDYKEFAEGIAEERSEPLPEELEGGLAPDWYVPPAQSVATKERRPKSASGSSPRKNAKVMPRSPPKVMPKGAGVFSPPSTPRKVAIVDGTGVRSCVVSEEAVSQPEPCDKAAAVGAQVAVEPEAAEAAGAAAVKTAEKAAAAAASAAAPAAALAAAPAAAPATALADAAEDYGGKQLL